MKYESYESCTLAQLGHLIHWAFEEYRELPMDVMDELATRCPDPDKAQALFDFHANAYRRTPSEKNFYEAYAMLCLTGELTKRQSLSQEEKIMNHLKLIRKPNGMLTYRYRAIYHNKDIVCEFNLLCEVGERYRRQYQKRLEFMAAHGWKFETCELSVSPWIADFAFRVRATSEATVSATKLSQTGEKA